ncbi:MAG: class I SAM-dependent methyltransferase [Parcubacteria group bacterium]|jgi:2-polyprenyl-3-methyl-5-hydroxy-6-metoxy-1,4-benzoquinol methylase
MPKKEIFENYMSLIYSSSERENNIDEEYERLYFWNKKYIGAALPENKESRFLDIGCGLGQNLHTFSKLGYRNIKGIDISPECVAFCEKQGFVVEKISAEEYLKDRADFFDVITIYHVVEHIEKKQIVPFLSILKDALKAGGKLIVNIPNGNNAIGGMHDRYTDITHEILYTPESMREVLLLSGFEAKNIAIEELVAYAPDDKRFMGKLLKKIILPLITKLVDLVWYVFFISQGATPRKNRPVLLAISKK